MMSAQHIANKKILIVDDHLEILNLMQIVLNERNYQVDIAVNGYDAIEKISKGDYALVITDINMPGMCGNNLVKAIRLNRGCRHMPVIAMTAEPWNATEAFDYVVKKPFLTRNLCSVIESMITGTENKVVAIKKRSKTR